MAKPIARVHTSEPAQVRVTQKPPAGLFDPLETFSYGEQGSSAQEEFEEQVLRAQEVTLLNIRSVKQLLVDARGTTPEGFRYSASAASQICNRICPNLFGVICHVSGDAVGKKFPDRVLSLPVAAGMLNELLRLRFERVKDFRIVADVRGRKFLGFVGRHYNLLTNARLYLDVKKFFEERRRGTFYRAYLVGTHLWLRFLADSPCFRLSAPSGDTEPYYRGWQFVNSETGDAALRGNLLLVRKCYNSVAVSTSPHEKRLNHGTAEDFEEMYSKFIGSVYRSGSRIRSLGAQTRNLAETRLGFSLDSTQSRRRVDQLTQILCRVGLDKHKARQAVTHAWVVGCHGATLLDTVDPASPSSLISPGPVGDPAFRTAYDLYNVLGTVAQSLAFPKRELTEKVAYDVLFGNLKLEGTHGYKKENDENDEDDSAAQLGAAGSVVSDVEASAGCAGQDSGDGREFGSE